MERLEKADDKEVMRIGSAHKRAKTQSINIGMSGKMTVTVIEHSLDTGQGI
jgi:hypothetical protein